VAAQNAKAWHAFYLMYDPVPRHSLCSYKVFSRSWRSNAKEVGLTGRKGQRLLYSNIHVWTDDVTGSYAFASYDMYIGRVFVEHVSVGQDKFIRRSGRWYDAFDNGEYASDCV